MFSMLYHLGDRLLGGGLSVNYGSDCVTPTMHEYASALRCACPDVFNRQPSNGSDYHTRKLTVITGETLVSQLMHLN